MTAAEACTLAVALTRQLSTARREAHSHRVLAHVAIHHAHQLHVDLERLRAAHARLVEEYRTLRELVLTEAA